MPRKTCITPQWLIGQTSRRPRRQPNRPVRYVCGENAPAPQRSRPRSMTRHPPLRMYCPSRFSLIQVEYRAKHRKEGSHGLSMLGRPDIEMAKKAARLSSQVIQMGVWQLSREKPRRKSGFPALKCRSSNKRDPGSWRALLSFEKLDFKSLARTLSLVSL